MGVNKIDQIVLGFMIKMSESNNSNLLANIFQIYVDVHSSSKFYYNFIGSEYCNACSLYISCKEIKGRSYVQKENFQHKNLKPKILKPYTY